jgi:hypothetical protein
MYSSLGGLAYLMYFAQKHFRFFKTFMELFVFIIKSLTKIHWGVGWNTLGNFSNISSLQSNFRMTDLLKIVVCFLKSVK